MTTWRKSSYSNGSSACIEVRIDADGDARIRESERPGCEIWTPARNWAAFIAGVKAGEFDDLDEAPASAIRCSLCQRPRAIGDPVHPMDAYDYNPMQAITGQPLGWYSGDDGEVCPECMTHTMRGGQ